VPDTGALHPPAMSMSDPFLPVPPEDAEGRAEEREIEDLEDDEQPDVLRGTAGDDEDELAAAAQAAEPDRFRTPRAGDALTAAELEDELD
jgi:hypothetical protein